FSNTYNNTSHMCFRKILFKTHKIYCEKSFLSYFLFSSSSPVLLSFSFCTATVMMEVVVATTMIMCCSSEECLSLFLLLWRCKLVIMEVHEAITVTVCLVTKSPLLSIRFHFPFRAFIHFCDKL
ncbi:hypothetical protein VIGAN_06175600, partial [Vigna angularis var. angularis]